MRAALARQHGMKVFKMMFVNRRYCVYLLFAILISLAPPAVGQETPLPLPETMIIADAEFIDPDAVLEQLIDGSALGIALPGDVKVGCDGLVYFSDVSFSSLNDSYTERGTQRAGIIWRYDPETAIVSVFRSPSGMANGLAFDAECHLLAAEGADFGGRRITRVNFQTMRAEIVAGLFEDKPLNAPNDLVLDTLGRIYFTDSRYQGHEPVQQDGNAIYRIDLNGEIERIIEDLSQPNGIALSPDERTLYVSNFGGLRLSDSLWAYTLHDDGTVSSPRVIVDFDPERGVDGFSVDQEGNLWVSVHNQFRPGIYAYTPEGVEKAYIRVKRPWNTGFGRGSQSHVLYFTANRNLYRIAVNKPGYHLPLIQIPSLSETPSLEVR